MNSSEFDRRFAEGESVINALDLSAARRPRLEQRRVNVDFPIWPDLDGRAARPGSITPGGDAPVDYQGLAG